MSRRTRAGWWSAQSQHRGKRCAPRRLRGGFSRPLRLEPLEDRRLLAVVTVNTLSDTINLNDNLTTLREAIFATNTVAGPDQIYFDPSLLAGGSSTLKLTQGELAIT